MTATSSSSSADLLLELLSEQARDCAAVELDENGLILRWTRGGQRLFGVDAAAVGSDFVQFLAPDQRTPEAVPDLIRKIQSNQRGEATLTLQRANGQAFSGQALLAATQNGGIVLAIRDLSVLQSTHAHLHALATIDQVTGLANRQHLFEMGRIEYRRWKRYKVPLSVLLLELVEYPVRLANQTPEIIERALCDVADVLQQCVRELDMAAYIDDGAFVCLLPNTPQEGAAVLAERIRAALKKNLIGPPNQRFAPQARFVALTGNPTLPDFEGLMLQAHEALATSRHGDGETIVLV